MAPLSAVTSFILDESLAFWICPVYVATAPVARIAIRIAMTIDELKMVVPISPAKNRSVLATTPNNELTLPKTLLLNITIESIKTPIKRPLRPAV